ncbi:MAG: alpha/beta hydrolase [Deltaproteobacteria bacterium]|nr:alpha/beta hydrolase [Deltaproteobacteria bacterium]
MPSPEHDSVVHALRAMPSLGSENDLDIARARAQMESLTANPQIPYGTTFETISAAGVPAEWVTAHGSEPAKVVLYLHGGGYALGSIATHRGLTARIAVAAGTRVLSLGYRLAPETPFPGAVEDATAAYGFLLEQGIAPENIAIGGDSAGGGLTFATLVSLKDHGQPLPAAAFGLSPWIDLEGLGRSMKTRAAADPMIQKDGLARFAKLYLADADPKNPLAAPLYADLSGLPPILIQVGTAETLLDDSIRIADRLREAGGSVELQQYQDLIHVFQAFAPIVPEAVEAIQKIGDFVKRHL